MSEPGKGPEFCSDLHPGESTQDSADALERLAQLLPARCEREPDVSGPAEPGTRHAGDTRLLEQEFGEGVVVREPSAADGVRDIAPRVERSRGEAGP